jgi:hypothetical protein
MEVALATVEVVDDCLEGAVIESVSAGKDGGFQFNLADGRTLLIPDAEIIAVIPRETH